MKRIVSLVLVFLLLTSCSLFVAAKESDELLGEELTKELVDNTPDYVREWMTKLGVDEITPLLCRFSERKNLRNDRLEKIILSAAKQSLTPYLPKLNELTDFATLMQQYGGNEDIDKYIAHCYKDEKRELKDALQKGRDVLILIGPEGDFSEQEVELAMAKGFVPVGLGRSRLRTETAGVVACHTAVLLNED